MCYKKEIQLWIEITSKCNYSCYYCYNQFPNNSSSKKTHPISPKRIRDFLAKINNVFSISLIAISGGEPLLNKELIDFIEACRIYSENIIIATNGSLLPDSDISKIINMGCNNFQVSILGDSNESHDRNSGLKNSFEKIISGLILLKDFNVNISLVFIWSKRSRQELLGVIEIAFLLGIGQIIINEERIQHCEIITRDKLNIEKIKRVFISDLLVADKLASKLNVSLIVPTYLPNYIFKNNKFSSTEFTFHQTHVQKIIIDSNGFIKTCVASSKSIGSIDDSANNGFFEQMINHRENDCPCKIEKARIEKL